MEKLVLARTETALANIILIGVIWIGKQSLFISLFGYDRITQWNVVFHRLVYSPTSYADTLLAKNCSISANLGNSFVACLSCYSSTVIASNLEHIKVINQTSQCSTGCFNAFKTRSYEIT